MTDPYNDSTQGKDKREWYTCEDYGTACSARDESAEPTTIRQNTEAPSREHSEELDLPSTIQ